MSRPARTLPKRALALLALVALMPAPASAWPEDGGVPPRPRSQRQARPLPVAPRATVVSGYLPRNNNVPMYNEPPRLRSTGGPAW